MWEKIKKFILNNWPIWLLIAISAVVYHKWLSFGIFLNADYGFTFSETLRDYLQYSAWESQMSLGSSNLFLWTYLFRLTNGAFGFFGSNINIADKFLIFWPFVFFTPIFSYLFVKEVLKNKVGAFVGACVYTSSTYYISINTQGHLPLTLAGTFAPLTMLFFWRYFESGKIKNLIFSALSSLLIVAYDFRVFYILFFILFSLPFWFLFLQRGAKKKKTFFWKNFWPMVLFFGGLFLLNIFWIWPTVMTGSLISNEIVNRPLVANNYYLDLRKSLTLFHPFWNGSEPSWFHEQGIPFYFWLIPIMLSGAIFWARKERKIIFWALVALLAVFLSKQDARPILGIYPWLYDHFPGFNAFREASKFYFASLLSYAVLIGYFVKHIHETWSIKQITKYTITFLIAGIFLWNVKPILTGEMFEMFTPREIPTRDNLIREYILKQNKFDRTLIISDFSKFMTYSNAHPVIDANVLRKSQWSKIVDFEDVQGDGLGGSEKVAMFLSKNFATNVLSQSGFGSIVVSEKDFYKVENLVKNSAWQEVDFEIPETHVFQNKSVKPRIYLSEKKESVYQIQPFQTVEFSSKNPAHWNVSIPKSKDNVWLNFSENYHPDWRLVCGDFKWYDAIFHKKMFPADIHYQTDAGLNTFKFEKNDWQNVCAEKDTQEIKVGLFYTPQAYLYLGGIISLSTIIASFLVLVFWREKGDNKKDE